MGNIEFSNLPEGFIRNEWGVIHKEWQVDSEWGKIFDIPSDRDSLITLSQYVVGNFAKCEKVIINVDSSVPVYPHERVIIDSLMRGCGEYHDGGIFMSSTVYDGDNILEKLPILSCFVLCMISYSKSFQLVCGNDTRLLVSINEQGAFSVIGKYFDVFSLTTKNSLSDCPPAPWVLDMLSQSQS